LPFDPDPAKVEAKFDKGVLHIHLPKPAEVAKKQQKIERRRPLSDLRDQSTIVRRSA
jgi:hypothetical protein